MSLENMLSKIKVQIHNLNLNNKSVFQTAEMIGILRLLLAIYSYKRNVPIQNSITLRLTDHLTL